MPVTRLFKKIPTALLSSLLVVSLLTNIFLFYKDRAAGLHTVTEVKDGDTVVIDDNELIRLAGIDAPEPSHCGGQESTSFLNNLVNGQKVRLTKVGMDKYARTLAILTLYDLNVNQAMLTAGWAVYDSYSGPNRDEMNKAGNQAKSNAKGLFALCRSGPDKSNCTIKGNINRATKSYFLSTCSNYDQTIVEKDRGEAWFCTETEAKKAGFIKSAGCN